MSAGKGVWLAGNLFNTKKRIKDRFSEIRDSQCTLTKDEAQFVMEVAEYHPKFEGVEIVEARCGKGKEPYGHQNAMWAAYRVDGSVHWVSIACGDAVNAMMDGKDKAKTKYIGNCVYDNFRLAIEYQRRDFRDMHVFGGRVKCNSATCLRGCVPMGECDVDHVGGQDDAEMFINLVRRFVEKETEINPTFLKEDYFDKYNYSERSEIARRWMQFHEKHAVLQMLCKKCHYEKSGLETSRRSVKARMGGVASNGSEPAVKRPRATAGTPTNKARRDAIKEIKRSMGGEHPCAKNVEKYISALAARGFQCSATQVYGAASGLKANWHTSEAQGDRIP